jgi:glycogen debranching enzyme
MNTLGGTGLWNEDDGFYYDELHLGHDVIPLRLRSMVGIIPLFAVDILDENVLARLPGFRKRMQWFLDHRKDLARHISYLDHRAALTVEEGVLKTRNTSSGGGAYLLAIPSRHRLERVLSYLLDEKEFLSPFGIRSLSAYHRDHPFTMNLDGADYCARYTPGESDSDLFGGNSNWRGPVWFPLNYLLIESLERYHHFYRDTLLVELPTGSGHYVNLAQVAAELSRRLSRPFMPDEKGIRPCHGEQDRFNRDPHYRDLLLFHEYFHGDTGRGLGASHQTGWTALVTRLLPGMGEPPMPR